MSRKIDIDEGIKNRKLGMPRETFIESVTSKTDERFSDLRVLSFKWNKDQNKLFTHLPSNKICFPHINQDIEIEPGKYYICLVYEPEAIENGGKTKPKTFSFAKAICEIYQPRIFITDNHTVTYVWRDPDSDEIKKYNINPKKMKGDEQVSFGATYPERIVEAVKAFENMGFPTAVIEYRMNQYKKANEGDKLAFKL